MEMLLGEPLVFVAYRNPSFTFEVVPKILPVRGRDGPSSVVRSKIDCVTTAMTLVGSCPSTAYIVDTASFKASIIEVQARIVRLDFPVGFRNNHKTLKRFLCKMMVSRMCCRRAYSYCLPIYDLSECVGVGRRNVHNILIAHPQFVRPLLRAIPVETCSSDPVIPGWGRCTEGKGHSVTTGITRYRCAHLRTVRE